MSITPQQLAALQQAMAQKSGRVPMPQRPPMPAPQQAPINLQTLMALKQKMAAPQPASPPLTPGVSAAVPLPRYADGGEVPDELAPYMPSKEEEENSGYPPGPQRALYIAQRKKNAADAATPAMSDGGETQKKTIGQIIGYPGTNPSPAPAPSTVPGYADGTPAGPIPDSAAQQLTPEQIAIIQQLSNNVPVASSPDTMPMLPDTLAAGTTVTPQQIAALSIPSQTQASTNEQQIPLPNGGLTGQALQDYIKANPGPVAVTGNNPSAPEEDQPKIEINEGDDEPEEQEPRPSPAPQSAQEASEDEDDQEDTDKGPSPTTSTPINSYQALMNRLAAAQQAQSEMQQSNTLNMAGKEIAAAMSRGGYKPNYAANDQLAKNATMPVQNILMQQAAAEQNIKQQMSQLSLSTEQQKNDPNSNASKNARLLAQYQAEKLGVPLQLDATTSASDIESGMGMNLEKLTALQSAQDVRKMAMQQSMMMRQLQMEHGDINKQNSAEQKLGQQWVQLNSPRGANGLATRNAMLADRIISQANQFNPKNPENSKLVLADTMGALQQGMTGAVATQAGIDKAYDPTAIDSLNKLRTYFTGDIQGRDVSQILGQVKQLAQTLKDSGTGYAKSNAAGLLLGAKNAVRPEVYESYKKKANLTEDDINGPTGLTAATGGAPAPAAPPVRMRGPDGQIRMIPANLVDSAKASGGTLVQ